MDTANKRYSVLAGDLDFLTVYPIPDGTIDVGDRYQIAWLYRALADNPPEPIETPAERTLRVRAQDRAFAVGADLRGVRVRRQQRTFEVE